MAGPEISVVIPAFERISALEGCLHALAAQTLPPSKFEVIVCDDGSRPPVRDGLASTLVALANRMHVRVIRQDNGGPAAARNRGAAAAIGRYLAFTDDDCRPEPDWLERLLLHFAMRPGALVGGGLRNAACAMHARRRRSWISFMPSRAAQWPARFRHEQPALPASGFRGLGGFSSISTRAAGEDYDLCARWYGGGGEIAYAPDAVVAHDHALTLGAYWLQHFTYGRGLLQVRQRLRRTGVSMRPGSLPGSFHLRLIASPVVRAGPRGAVCAALVGLAQAATVAGVLAEVAMPTFRPKARRGCGVVLTREQPRRRRRVRQSRRQVHLPLLQRRRDVKLVAVADSDGDALAEAVALSRRAGVPQHRGYAERGRAGCGGRRVAAGAAFVSRARYWRQGCTCTSKPWPRRSTTVPQSCAHGIAAAGSA
jgi:glycosyltransferase involved in cell wall biosynthesis